jgi:hypothetical protein
MHLPLGGQAPPSRGGTLSCPAAALAAAARALLMTKVSHFSHEQEREEELMTKVSHFSLLLMTKVSHFSHEQEREEER